MVVQSHLQQRGHGQRGSASTSSGHISLPPLKDLGLPTIPATVSGQQQQQYPYGPRPGEGDHRWLTGSEIANAASTVSQQTLSRETPGLRGRPQGGRIPTQSRGRARSRLAIADPRPRVRPQGRRDSEEDSSDSSTEEDRMGVDR